MFAMNGPRAEAAATTYCRQFDSSSPGAHPPGVSSRPTWRGPGRRQGPKLALTGALAAALVAALGSCGGDAGAPSRAPAAGPATSATGRTAPVVAAPVDPLTPTAGTRPDPAAAQPAEPTPARLRFLAVGDIMLSRRVAHAMREAGDLQLPFRALADQFAAVDFTFANLESPFSSRDGFGIGPAHNFNTPPSHIQGLVAHRFSVVTLANNHALDQGVAGLRFTLEHLDAHGIQHVGAGMDPAAAWQPAIVDRHGIRVGFLGASYASVNDSGRSRNPYVARLDQDKRLAAAMASLRPEVDYLAVAMHAGREYLEPVDDTQRRFARRAIDLGADVVLGSHPHVAQAVELYQGKPIFYSLGNFIFDHEPEPTRQGLMVRTTLRATAPAAAATERVTVEQMELAVVIIEGRSTPRAATDAESTAVLARIGVTDPILLPRRGDPR